MFSRKNSVNRIKSNNPIQREEWFYASLAVYALNCLSGYFWEMDTTFLHNSIVLEFVIFEIWGKIDFL